MRKMVTKEKPLGIRLLEATLVTIAVVPGIGLSTLLLLLARKNKPKGVAAPANDRGQYG